MGGVIGIEEAKKLANLFNVKVINVGFKWLDANILLV